MPTDKEKSNGGITFVCEAGPAAKAVFLAGDFNDWNPGGIRMVKRGGVFRKTLDLPSGPHQYKFVVDGVWQPDPAAVTHTADGYGGQNSVTCA